MKLLIVLLSAALTTTATPWATELAALPEDNVEAALAGLGLALTTGAISSSSADLGRAALAFAEPASPGDTLRAAAQLAAQQDAQRGVDASSTLAEAERTAAILDLVDSRPRETVADVLAFTADVARIRSSSLGLDARMPLAFTSPGAALQSMVTASGATWTDAMAADARTLDTLPEPTRTGVLTILDTHIAARAHLEQEAARGVDADARGFIAERVSLALPSLTATQSHMDLVACGLYNLRLSDEDSLHTCVQASLVTLDLGGDDVYHANGGAVETGCSPFFPPCVPEPSRAPFVIHLDVTGNDLYTTTGTSLTYAYLMGASGEYGATFSTFFDLVGDDIYSVTEKQWATRGVGQGGLFLDAAGNDIHLTNAAGSKFINHEFGRSGGIFIDASGSDRYDVLTTLYCAGDGGVVLDLGGADTWNVGCYGAFGVGRGGLFVDAGQGSDSFRTFAYRSYSTLFRSSFGGCDLGVCVFRDEGGDNTFLAQDRERSLAMGATGGYPLNAALTQGQAVGLMLVGEGNDHYEITYDAPHPGPSSGPSRVAMGAAATGVGILIDEGGSNTYIVGAADLAQGAATNGVGIFVDRGADSSISLGGGMGQGASIRGVGMLIRTRGDALTSYAAAPGALPSLAVGGGIGMRVHRGPVDILGQQPDFACRPDALAIAAVSGVVIGRRLIEASLCAPGDQSGDQIVNPVTQEPMDDLDRPAVPCSSGLLGDLGCEQIVTDAWGEDTVDWLDDTKFTMRSSGGFSWLSAAGQLSTMLELQSVDNACKISCQTWTNLDRVG